MVKHYQTEVKEYDEGRTFELLHYGITIIRYTNDEILNNIDNVIAEIENVITTLTPKSLWEFNSFPFQGKGFRIGGKKEDL